MTIEALYEELRKIIDGGSESMTHKDAVLELQFVFSEYDRLTAIPRVSVDPNGLLTDQELDELARQLPAVEAWIKAVESELLRRLETGSAFNNVRLAPKRANRKWADDFATLNTLLTLLPLDQAAPRCILSPAQAEKAVGKSAFANTLDNLTIRESSGMTLKFTN